MNTPFSISPGDVLLTCSRTLSGTINRSYQRVRRWSDFRALRGFLPTHAALALTSDHIVHSIITGGDADKKTKASARKLVEMLAAAKLVGLGEYSDRDGEAAIGIARRLMGHGVEIESIYNFTRGLKAEDVILVRHSNLRPYDMSLMSQLLNSALYHLDMLYNPLIEASGGRNVSMFCSQLIYKILTHAGIKLPERLPHRVLPADFLVWARQQKWKVVAGEKVLNAVAEGAKFKELEASVASNSEDTAHAISRDPILQSVALHHAVVSRFHDSQEFMKALDTLDQITADLVRATRASAISMRQLMDANLQPVAYSVEGAVVASEHIRRALNILDAPIISIGAVERSDGSKELGQEQLSWKLQKSKKGISQEIRRQENKLLLAESFLDDARSFVDGFDAAAKDALLLLERFGIESQGTISRIWLDFLESEPMQLLLYTTGFFAREKPFEELREEAKKVSEGFAALLALVIETGQQLQALNSQVASTSLDQHSEFKIQQNSRLIKLIYLCRIYAIVNDFSDTVLWLKMYGQERPFAETLHALAVAGNPLFKECIKNLAELPRVRLAADTVWDTLNIDVSRSKNQPKKPSH